MDLNYTDATPGVAPLSEAKQRLLKAYIGNAVRTRTEQPTVSGHPPEERQLVGSGPQAVRIRELSVQDYPRVSALEVKYGLGLKSYEQWSHVWLNNPAYKEVRDHWPLGWVLESEDRQIVGSVGNIPLLYECRGQRMIVATGRGFVVDAPYRGYSLWPLMAFWDQKNAGLCLDTSVNSQASQVSSALGAVHIPAGAWDRNVFWVTNYRGCVSVRLKRKISGKLSFLVGPICVPLAAALFLRDTLAAAALPRLESRLELEYQTAFDDRFNEFWEELKRENPGLLLAVRTREMLDWHFAYARLQNRLWIWTITRNSHLVAYALFLKTTSFGVTRVSLVDFQAVKGKAALLLPMVSAALERCRREGVHLLENPGLAFGESGINQLAPHRLRTDSWSFFYKARDNELAQTLKNPGVWAPSLYDGDASIV